jgi:hypothetical protein
VPQGLVGNEPGAMREERDQPAGEPCGELGGDTAVAASDVRMGQGRPAWQAIERMGQGLAEVAEEQMMRIWPIVRMGLYLPIEDEDLSRRKKLPQVIVGAAVAEAQFEYRPRQIRNLGCGELEASALRLKPAYEAVETAHLGSFVPDIRGLPSACLRVNNGSIA